RSNPRSRRSTEPPDQAAPRPDPEAPHQFSECANAKFPGRFRRRPGTFAAARQQPPGKSSGQRDAPEADPTPASAAPPTSRQSRGGLRDEMTLGANVPVTGIPAPLNGPGTCSQLHDSYGA